MPLLLSAGLALTRMQKYGPPLNSDSVISNRLISDNRVSKIVDSSFQDIYLFPTLHVFHLDSLPLRQY